MKTIKTYEDFVNEEINLKKALTTGALAAGMAFGNPAKSQITTTKVTPTQQNQQVNTQPYDSLSNFVGKDIKKLIGQTLYCKPESIGLRKYAYKDFYTEYKPDMFRGIEKYTYKPVKDNRFPGQSEYDSLAGKYFTVIEVLDAGEIEKSYDYFYLKLKENESGDIVYYKYNGSSSFTFPFIIVGYFEKLKSKYIGKEFILPPRVLKNVSKLKDIETGNPIDIKPGQKWKCIDVTVDDE